MYDRSGPSDSPRAILEVSGLSKAFGSVRAADHVTLDVRKGEALGIIGPNGAGKSSLFNLITGDLTADAGTIRLNGRDITRTTPHRRCRAGIARSYQIPRPFENLSVFENLLVGAAFGQDKREADVVDHCADVLARTGLMRHANALAGSLTLLERKRLELARALACRPRVLFLDEVLTGLNPRELAEGIALVRQIAELGISIVVVEHIMRVILDLCEHLTVLNFGRVIARGQPEACLRDSAVVEAYLGHEHA
jgi:branched-chain amino acid transport system ATP-binding protein